MRPRAEVEPYPVLPTAVDRGSEAFAANQQANQASLDKLAGVLAQARAGGGEKYTARHKAKGKLLPRERVELLIDRDAHFLELCPLAGFEISGHSPGSSIIGGVGVVSGVECLITASDSTVKGGAVSEYGVVKSAASPRSPSTTGCPRSGSPSRPAPTCPTSTRSSCRAAAPSAT